MAGWKECLFLMKRKTGVRLIQESRKMIILSGLNTANDTPTVWIMHKKTTWQLLMKYSYMTILHQTRKTAHCPPWQAVPPCSLCCTGVILYSNCLFNC